MFNNHIKEKEKALQQNNCSAITSLCNEFVRSILNAIENLCLLISSLVLWRVSNYVIFK